MAAKEVEDTCDDSFELEDLEESFDDLTILGKHLRGFIWPFFHNSQLVVGSSDGVDGFITGKLK